MKVLITGVNGFIGRRLAGALAARSHAVIGFDLQPEPAVEGLEAYFEGSVLDAVRLEEAIRGADAVVHLAALTAHQDIVDNRFQTFEINFLGTKHVLDAFRQSKSAKKFLYSSTGKVYGTIQDLPISEEHPTIPLNALGKSKLMTEQLIDFYSGQGKEQIIFRIFNVYGPGQKENFLIPTILSQLESARAGSRVDIMLGDVEAARDYVYLDDVVEAFVQALEGPGQPGLSIYNLCTGRATNAREIVSSIGGIMNLEIKIYVNKRLVRPDEMAVEYGSFERARRQLGWTPRCSLEEGLKETIENRCGR